MIEHQRGGLTRHAPELDFGIVFVSVSSLASARTERAADSHKPQPPVDEPDDAPAEHEPVKEPETPDPNEPPRDP